MWEALKVAVESGDWIEGEARKEYDEAIVRCALKAHRYNTTATKSAEEIQDAIADITESDADRTSLVLFPFRCDLESTYVSAGM